MYSLKLIDKELSQSLPSLSLHPLCLDIYLCLLRCSAVFQFYSFSSHPPSPYYFAVLLSVDFEHQLSSLAGLFQMMSKREEAAEILIEKYQGYKNTSKLFQLLTGNCFDHSYNFSVYSRTRFGPKKIWTKLLGNAGRNFL